MKIRKQQQQQQQQILRPEKKLSCRAIETSLSIYPKIRQATKQRDLILEYFSIKSAPFQTTK